MQDGFQALIRNRLETQRNKPLCSLAYLLCLFFKRALSLTPALPVRNNVSGVRTEFWEKTHAHTHSHSQ